MFENLTEHLVKFDNDLDFEDLQPGQGGTYLSELRDPSGDVVATVDASYKIIMRRDSDGELMTCITEKLAFADGDMHVEGWARFSNITSGEWLYLPVSGVSGRYAGRTGLRQWRPIEPGKVGEAKILFFTTLLS
ncbi:MAG TPA: hypothetical protein VIU15_07535 [Streptomyces sp.]